MRNFLFAVTLLLLAGGALGVGKLIPPPKAKPTEFNFGDIIRFDGHYGVALGELDGDGRELFFHKIKDPAGGPTCVIWRLSTKTENRKKDNYQDEHELTSDESEAIRKRLEECKGFGLNDIRAINKCCGSYDMLTNNCEHTATYIRYGAQGRVSCLVRSGAKDMVKLPLPKKCAHWVDLFP